ncbi:cyclin-dependent kinase inhibitor 3-like [Panicum miliaceum]|uniref:Cyclin-dependent kinase inhibitor 3-like n=1 Tax=Panicum miliaceum TaxID=4540 RepID=A0A3L6Q148_PANMI|nr:cyclin-dependent kinase inhibitor 3-like [Panicum miliaceum]
MGKCVRISGSKPPPPGEAAAYLTLRSGRRVPVAVAAAACSPPGRRRSSRGSACRGCGATAAAKRACGSPGRRKRAEPPRPALSGPEEELPPPPQASPGARDGVEGDRGDSSEANTPLSGDGVVQLKREHESKAGVAAQPPPPLEAEMEAFFAAAELAERRRFAEAYNYDVALDRPLEGRFEWAPVSCTEQGGQNCQSVDRKECFF